MRVRVLIKPSVDEVDGIDLRRFVPGEQYDVGNLLAELMVAEGWAEPLADDEPAPVVPFSDADPFVSRVIRESPPNLARDIYPPSLGSLSLASDLERRKRGRKL